MAKIATPATPTPGVGTTLSRDYASLINFLCQAIGICSGCARLFGLGCPFMGNLAVYWKPLPMVLLGAPTLAVALLMTKLPETANKDLPQDFEDGDALNNGRWATKVS